MGACAQVSVCASTQAKRRYGLEAEYKERWQKVCRDLDAVEAMLRCDWLKVCCVQIGARAHMQPLPGIVLQAPGQKTILFHCFAGLNRSTSALCAFMILRALAADVHPCSTHSEV